MKRRRSRSRCALPAAVAAVALMVLAAGCGDAGRPTGQAARPAILTAGVPGAARLPSAFQSAWQAARAKATAAPGQPAALVDLARLAHANGFVREAAELWQTLREAQPEEPRWSYLLAEALRRQGEDEAAGIHWVRTTERAPDYAPAWLRRADFAFKRGNLADATAGYARRLALVADDPYAQVGLARVALQQGQKAAGRAKLEAVVRQHPQFSSAQTLLAQILAESGDVAGAARHRWLATTAQRYQEAPDPWIEELQAWCYDATLLARRAAVLIQAGRAAEAESVLQRAIELSPSETEPAELLGRLYLDQERPADAQRVLAAGVRQEDATAAMWADLSAAHRALQRTAEAERTAREGLAAFPESAVLCQALGLALAAGDQPAAAREAYTAALAADPRWAEPAIHLATLELQQGKTGDAMATLRLALERQPFHPRAVVMLSNLEMDAGRLDLAGDRLRPVLAAYPERDDLQAAFARWYLQRALAAAQAGQPATAVQLAKQGVAALPNAAELHGFLGFVHAQEGRTDQAITALENAARLQPSDPRIVVSLVQVYGQLRRFGDARRILEAAERDARARGDAAAADQYAQFLAQVPR